MIIKQFLNIMLCYSMLSLTIMLFSFTKPGRVVQDFNLKNVDGRYVSLKDYKNAKGYMIVFTCNHCPYAKRYPERLNELNKKYIKKGVRVIAINSADTLEYIDDSYQKMVAVSKACKFNYPYLYDNMQTIAKNFGAQKTPQVFLIWKEGSEWVVKYNGAIDDNGADANKVQHHYLADAVDALLKGQTVEVAETKSIGCGIRWRK